MPSRQIVIDDNFVPATPQGASCVTSDVTCASNDENNQRLPPCFWQVGARNSRCVSTFETLQFNGSTGFCPTWRNTAAWVQDRDRRSAGFSGRDLVPITVVSHGPFGYGLTLPLRQH